MVQSRLFLNLSNTTGVQVGGWVLIAWRANWYLLCRPACSSPGYQLQWRGAVAGPDSAVVANLLILSTSLHNLPTAGCSITLEMKSERGQASQINNFRWRISLCVDRRERFAERFVSSINFCLQLQMESFCFPFHCLQWLASRRTFFAIREPLLCFWAFNITFSAQ